MIFSYISSNVIDYHFLIKKKIGISCLISTSNTELARYKKNIYMYNFF